MIRKAQFALAAVAAVVGWNVVATVPAGHRWALRDWAITNFTGAGCDLGLAVRNGANYGVLAFTAGVGSTDAIQPLYGRQHVASEGDELVVFRSSAAGSVFAIVSGTDYTE